jgi:DNA repair protein SbcD/Mre11
MKIVHTSDWHLNSTLGRHQRNEDICRSLKQIAAYLEEHQVDVMIVSGDLFRERSRPEQMQAGVEIITQHFQPFIERGGTLIAISGNHDSDVFFEMLNDALKLAPGQKGPQGTDATGRIYLAPRPRVVKLMERDGEIVQFVLMPYPAPRHYLRGEKTNFQSPEERNRSVKEAYKQTLVQLQQRYLDPTLPSVLVSHVYVHGSQIASGHMLGETNEVVLELGDLPTSWSYIALGHIHQPQPVRKNAPHIRYAGSIECMDYGEMGEQKSAVLFEIKDRVLLGEPRELFLQSTPFLRIEITDPDTQIPLLAEQYPEAQQALVHYVLHWDSLTQQYEPYCQEIERIFSRCYSRNIKDIHATIFTEAGIEMHQTRDVVGTTRHYLQTQLEGHPEQQELLRLIERLFEEEELV